MSRVMVELNELQYLAALYANRLRMHLGEETDQFLDWLIPIVQAYDGPSKKPRLAENLLKMRQVPEARRHEVDLAMREENIGVGLVQLESPFLDSVSGELSVCALDFQRRVFRVKGQLTALNQIVDFLRSQFEKTFDTAIIGKNREIVEQNLTSGYRGLANQAELVARGIGEILAQYAPSGATGNIGTVARPNHALEPSAPMTMERRGSARSVRRTTQERNDRHP